MVVHGGGFDGVFKKKGGGFQNDGLLFVSSGVIKLLPFCEL